MRVLFSTDQIYLHGGIEKVLAEKANYFRESCNFEVMILTTEQKNNPPRYPLSSGILMEDLAVNYHRNRSFFHPLNLAKVPMHWIKRRRAIARFKPDVIIVCNYALDFVWTPFFDTKVPKIKEFHSSGFRLPAKRAQKFNLRQKLDDFVLSKFDAVVLLNASEKSFYPTAKSVVIPNPIPVSETPSAEKKKIILAAGRIAPVKNFEALLKIWKLASAQLPDWNLHIYGDGDAIYIDSLKQQIQRDQLPGATIFPATAELPNKMAEASLYVMTSHTECFPMVLLEALRAGLPVISFDCPTGPGHIVSHEQDGILVPHQNIEEFARKIVLLAGNPEQRNEMSGKGRQLVKRFQPETVMPLWLKLFQSLNKEHVD